MSNRVRLPPLAVGLLAVLLIPTVSVATPIRVTYDPGVLTNKLDITELGGNSTLLITRETMDFFPSTFQRGYLHAWHWMDERNASEAFFCDSSSFHFKRRVKWPMEHYPHTTVPEPGSVILLGAGVIAMGFARRRMKSS
jgi:hypothetical protein